MIRRYKENMRMINMLGLSQPFAYIFAHDGITYITIHKIRKVVIH